MPFTKQKFCKNGHNLEETRHHNRCKICRTRSRQKWAKENVELLRVNDKRFRDSLSPEEKEKRLALTRKLRRERKYGEKYRLERYGLTEASYKVLEDKYNGRCHICLSEKSHRRDKDGCDTRFAIDHCHKTGRVRGLLCHTCNRTLGIIKENTNTLERMIQYLRDQ